MESLGCNITSQHHSTYCILIKCLININMHESRIDVFISSTDIKKCSNVRVVDDVLIISY